MNLLRKELTDKQLTRKQAASLIGVSIHTMNNWLLPKQSPGHRKMPSWPIELLRARLEQGVVPPARGKPGPVKPANEALVRRRRRRVRARSLAEKAEVLPAVDAHRRRN